MKRRFEEEPLPTVEPVPESTLQNLYSPALGLLMAKKGGRIGEEQFWVEFTKLSFKSRHEGTPEVRMEMEKWLSGENNENDIQVLLERMCKTRNNL